MNNLTIRTARPEDAEACGLIAAEAWAPVRESMRELIGPAVYALFGDTREFKRRAVAGAVTDSRMQVMVTEMDGRVAGFITFTIRKNDNGVLFGEICNNAVAPDAGGKGIGTAQCSAVIEAMKQQGAQYVLVDTGLDASHAPARRMYEKAGFDRTFEHVTYYMKL